MTAELLDKLPQIAVLAVAGSAFGYWARRFYWRQRMAKEVAGNDDVKAFEERVSVERLKAIKRKGDRLTHQYNIGSK